MQLSTRTQLRVGAVAFVLVAVAIVWMVTHRKGGSALPAIKAPHLIELKARGPSGERPLTDKPTVQTDDVLDFQIEIPEQCYLYVFRAQGGSVGLAWGHHLVDEAWNAGVYAPDWKDSRNGMPFNQSGTVKLFAIAAPFPLVGTDKWDLDALEDVKSQCERCGVTTVEIKVEEPPKK